LAVVPFFHSYGLSTCLTTGIASAATMVLFHRFCPSTVCQLIEKYQPTCFPAVPMMLHQLNAQFRRRKCGPRKLIRFCVSGGAPLSGDLATEFATHTGAVVVEGYGLSEASPVTHVNPMNGAARLGSIGLPLPDTDARIVDRKTGTTILPHGEIGELVVRGPQVMAGYYQDAIRTREAVREGWLHTGDLARQNQFGEFEIVDRKKDLIITSGTNVYPAEIEEVLRAYPEIADVAIIGVADPRRGEIVKAVITKVRGARFNRRAFDDYMEQHLAKYKRPKIIEFRTTDLPRNFLGKVVRRELR
jgi:long-chain acyl-CoA synthetase